MTILTVNPFLENDFEKVFSFWKGLNILCPTIFYCHYFYIILENMIEVQFLCRKSCPNRIERISPPEERFDPIIQVSMTKVLTDMEYRNKDFQNID